MSVNTDTNTQRKTKWSVGWNWTHSLCLWNVTSLLEEEKEHTLFVNSSGSLCRPARGAAHHTTQQLVPDGSDQLSDEWSGWNDSVCATTRDIYRVTPAWIYVSLSHPPFFFFIKQCWDKAVAGGGDGVCQTGRSRMTGQDGMKVEREVIDVC